MPLQFCKNTWFCPWCDFALMVMRCIWLALSLATLHAGDVSDENAGRILPCELVPSSSIPTSPLYKSFGFFMAGPRNDICSLVCPWVGLRSCNHGRLEQWWEMSSSAAKSSPSETSPCQAPITQPCTSKKSWGPSEDDCCFFQPSIHFVTPPLMWHRFAQASHTICQGARNLWRQQLIKLGHDSCRAQIHAGWAGSLIELELYRICIDTRNNWSRYEAICVCNEWDCIIKHNENMNLNMNLLSIMV